MRGKPLTEFLEKAECIGPKKMSSSVEGPWKLPEGWKWVRLGDLGKFEYGYTASATNEDTGVKFLRITDIDETGKIKWEQVPFCKISYRDFQKYVLRKGDLLFARIGATTGKATYIPNDINAVFASYLIRLKITRGDVIPKFVFYFTQTPYYWETIKEEMSDKLRKGINAKELARIFIPLPPPEEQKRIVVKLDEIRSRIEEARRLVRDAKEDAEKLIASAIHEVFSKVEEKGWRWVKLEKIIGIRRNSGVKKIISNFNKIAFIPMELIPENEIFVKYDIKKPNEIKSYTYCEPGDILLAKITPCFENGKQGIVPSGIPNGFALATTEVYPIYVKEEAMLDRMYLFYILRSRYVRKTLEEQMLGTTGRQRVPKEAVLKLKIPLPPFEEQKRIVAYLDAISERARQLIKLYEEMEKELEKLWFSALDKAFKGKL